MKAIPIAIRLPQLILPTNLGSFRTRAARITDTGIEAWRTALTAAVRRLET